MVTPTYHLACRIFEDNGFAGKLKAVPEDLEGINIDYLEKCLSIAQAANGYDGDKIVCFPCWLLLPQEVA